MTDIERVVQELPTVGPDIERDGQGLGWIDARGRGVERQLADRDRHPAGPLVAEAQDALVVGDDDEADVIASRSKDCVDPADVIGSDPDAARAPDDVAELLARETDGRRVDDRQELLEVLEEEPVEERLVAVLECGQSDVPLEVVVLAADVLELQPELRVDRRHTWRQQTVQAKGVALADRECRALVQERISDQIVPPAPDFGVAGRVRQRDHARRETHLFVDAESVRVTSTGGLRWANRYATRFACETTPTRAPSPSTTGRPVMIVERRTKSASSRDASTVSTAGRVVITSATRGLLRVMSTSSKAGSIVALDRGRR